MYTIDDIRLIDPETAEDDACKIEHDLSDQTFKMLKEHLREEHSL